MAAEIFVHAHALNECEDVGAGTRIWAFAHVMRGARIGRNCNIGDHAFVESGAEIGDGVTVKNSVCVWEGVQMEDYVFVGPNVTFTNDKYPRSPRAPSAQTRYAGKNWLGHTRIARGASIGAAATIVCGITVETCALVAAGAVVTRNVPAFHLVAGNPARTIAYVCRCGQPLPDMSGSLTCSTCGREYTAENRRVEEKEVTV